MNRKIISLRLEPYERKQSRTVLRRERGSDSSDLADPKLAKIESLKDIDDPILEWLEFIDAKSKEGMAMLAEKNENIKTAYEILQRASKSKEVRMAYEARQAEIMDQLTREKSAREEGIKKE